MPHAELEMMLSEYADGSLGQRMHEEVEAHVARCDRCGEWLETYRLLQASLGGEGGEHPSAEELARCALTDQAGGDDLQEHLGGCDDCRREIALTRSAVANARDESSSELATTLRNPWWRPKVNALVAAAAAVLVVAVALPRFLSRHGGGIFDRAALADEFMTGNHVITAADSITAVRTEVVNGADLTLRAGKVVELGDGFSVDSGANFKIEITGDWKNQ